MSDSDAISESFILLCAHMHVGLLTVSQHVHAHTHIHIHTHTYTHMHTLVYLHLQATQCLVKQHRDFIFYERKGYVVCCKPAICMSNLWLTTWYFLCHCSGGQVCKDWHVYWHTWVWPHPRHHKSWGQHSNTVGWWLEVELPAYRPFYIGGVAICAQHIAWVFCVGLKDLKLAEQAAWTHTF